MTTHLVLGTKTLEVVPTVGAFTGNVWRERGQVRWIQTHAKRQGGERGMLAATQLGEFF